MDDVTQVLVYLPDPSDFPGMNEIYAKAVKAPYPNRATIVAKLMVPCAKMEVVAYAHVGGRSAAREPPRVRRPRRRSGRGADRTTRGGPSASFAMHAGHDVTLCREIFLLLRHRRRGMSA